MHQARVRQIQVRRRQPRRADQCVCPICQWTGSQFAEFRAARLDRVYADALCPRCGSHPRHRRLYLFLQDYLRDRRIARTLHCAPERTIADVLRRHTCEEYVAIDKEGRRARRREDITQLTFDAESFDLIVCVHVLEHVPDDAAAVRELFRVLRPGGTAVIDVPIGLYLTETYHDPTIVTPQQRADAYWDPGHLRLYGRNFARWVESFGFRALYFRQAEARREELRPVLGEAYPLAYFADWHDDAIVAAGLEARTMLLPVFTKPERGSDGGRSLQGRPAYHVTRR